MSYITKYLPELEDLKKQIEELKKVYKQLTGKPVTIVDASTIKGIQDAQNGFSMYQRAPVHFHHLFSNCDRHLNIA